MLVARNLLGRSRGAGPGVKRTKLPSFWRKFAAREPGVWSGNSAIAICLASRYEARFDIPNQHSAGRQIPFGATARAVRQSLQLWPISSETLLFPVPSL